MVDPFEARGNSKFMAESIWLGPVKLHLILRYLAKKIAERRIPKLPFWGVTGQSGNRLSRWPRVQHVEILAKLSAN